MNNPAPSTSKFSPNGNSTPHSYSPNGTQNSGYPNAQSPVSPTTSSMYGGQMSPYHYYQQRPDQCYSPYYYNPWSYQQQTTTGPLFNPGQPPPPLPAEIMKPPPPPEPGFKRGGGRGRCVYPRGGALLVRGGLKRGSPFQSNKYQRVAGAPPPRPNESDVLDIDAIHDNNVQVHKKSKRKPMSARYTRRKKDWNREDAMKAIALEQEYHRMSRAPMLILKFPDPEITNHSVRAYSPFIESVHFQQPSTARYCFVQLKEGADIDEVREQISQIEFGTGKIVAEKKLPNFENQQTKPEEIDPYTLYIGNLPTSISVAFVKETFKAARYIDIGYAQRMKYTRYAFIRYDNVEEAMEAYKESYNLLINARSLIVRFRRQKGNVGLPGESKVPNPPKKFKPNQADQIDDLTVAPKTMEKPGTSKSKIIECVDSKENVLAEAQLLMRSAHEDDAELIDDCDDSTDGSSIRSGPIVTIKSEDGQIEVQDDEENTTLLGTKIKDEPNDIAFFGAPNLDHHELHEDDEDDELPVDEEDEIVQNDYHDNFTEGDDDDNDIYGRQHWDRLRLEELARKEEKPDITSLPPLKIRSVDDVPEVRVDKKTDERDDLDDLFNSMNPDDDDPY